jgi:hypothetical protein
MALVASLNNSFMKTRTAFAKALPAALGALLLSTSIRAEVIELVNGDHYAGAVVSMDRSTVEFRSEIQGVIRIPREKVARITFTTMALKPAGALPSSGEPTTQVANHLSKGSSTTNNAAAVVQQIRVEGVDPNTADQIQKQLLGQTSPEVTQMFNQMVKGLMTGSLTVDDIRAQARSALKDVREVRKEFDGDEGQVIDGYINILQKFLAESEPPPKTPVGPSGATK